MPVGQSFDITLNGKGYMLARGQFKGRAWKRMGAPNAVQPRATDSDTQRNALPPELDFVAVYDDFSGGFGDAYRSKTVANRIHWATNMETRFPGQAMHCQGLSPVRVALNSTTGGANTSDEYAAWIMQVPPIRQGAALPTASQVGQGDVLIFMAKATGQSNGTAGTALSYAPTGLDPNSFIDITTQPAAQSFDRVIEGLDTITGGLGSAAFSYGLNTARAAAFGSFVYAGCDPIAGYNGFVRRDMSGSPNAALTMNTLMPGAVFGVAGSRLWRAHGASGHHINYLQSCPITSDPMATANWSATLNIGGGQTDVQDMVAMDDQLFVSMQDGLYAGDTSGTFFNVLGAALTGQHIDNGRQVALHQRGVVYPYEGGLLYYHLSRISANQIITAAAVDDIGPQQYSQRSPLKGRFRTVYSYGGWLYGGLFCGTISYLLAGRDRGDGTYQWNPQQILPYHGGISQITVDTILTPSGGGSVASGNPALSARLWIGMQNPVPGVGNVAPGAAIDTFFAPIPNGDQNPLGALQFSANFTYTARMDLGRDTRGAPDTLKVLRRLDVNTDTNTMLSGFRYCDVYYLLDGAATRTLLGRAQTSPKSTLFFPAAEGSFVTCYDFELSVESVAASFGYNPGVSRMNAQCPVYRSFVLHGAFLADGTDQITAVLDMADRRADRQGTPMRSAAAQLSELRSLEGGPPVQLVDLAGAQNWVTVQRSVSEDETYQEGSDEPEVAATVKMSVLKFS